MTNSFSFSSNAYPDQVIPWSPIPSICDRESAQAQPGVAGSHFFPVGHNDVVNIFWRAPLGHVIIDSILVLDIEEQALRLPEESREVLYGVPLCRCIDDTEHLLQMVMDQLIFVKKS